MSENIQYQGQSYPIIDGKVKINELDYTVINSMKEFEGLCPNPLQDKSCSNITNEYCFDRYIFIGHIYLYYSIDKLYGNIFSTENNKTIRFINCIFVNSFRIFRGISGTPIESVLLVINMLNIEFIKSEFAQSCEILIPKIKDTFSIVFKECNFKKKLKIRGENLEELADFFKKGIQLTHYEIYQKIKPKIQKLEIIDCMADDGVYLRIGYLEVENFELSNLRLPQNAELNIGDCHFHSFKLTNFRNIGKFKLFKINILDEEKTNNPKFQIDNTSIGQTDFQSLDLVSFGRVVLFDNIFSNIDYTNVKWKQNIGVGQYGERLIREQIKQKSILKIIYNLAFNKSAKEQDTYRVLKNVTQRNNDTPQALSFYAKEMEYYRKIVKDNTDYSLSDRATLWFNKHTNNFGLSFLETVRVAIIVIYCGLFIIIANHRSADTSFRALE